MTYLELYERFEVPPNLRDHLLTVTKVAMWVIDRWTGYPLVDRDELLQACMLHDIANIAKFTLDDPSKIQDARLLQNLEFWRMSQAKFIGKYGSDDHAATEKILREVGVSDRIREAIQNKSFINIINNAESDDWLTKLVSYADFRVNPDGLATIAERVEYIRQRYPDKYGNRLDFPQMVAAMNNLEEQVSEHVSVPTDLLSIDELESDKVDYLSLQL